MIIKAKKQLFIKSNIPGALINLEIRDINTYYDRFDKKLIFNFGVYQNIENELRLFDKIILEIGEQDERDGLVLLPDNDNSGQSATKTLLSYYTEKKTLVGANIIEYGMPSIATVKSLFTGGTLETPEIQPVNDLAKEWLLNTLEFDNKKLKENFVFV